MARKTKSDIKTIKIQQVKSAIGYKKNQKLTIKALGIHRLREIVEKNDTPQIRGMVQKVSHLVRILD